MLMSPQLAKATHPNEMLQTSDLVLLLRRWSMSVFAGCKSKVVHDVRAKQSSEKGAVSLHGRQRYQQQTTSVRPTGPCYSPHKEHNAKKILAEFRGAHKGLQLQTLKPTTQTPHSDPQTQSLTPNLKAQRPEPYIVAARPGHLCTPRGGLEPVDPQPDLTWQVQERFQV